MSSNTDTKYDYYNATLNDNKPCTPVTIAFALFSFAQAVN